MIHTPVVQVVQVIKIHITLVQVDYIWLYGEADDLRQVFSLVCNFAIQFWPLPTPTYGHIHTQMARLLQRSRHNM
jgi:hypothetical protein